MGPGPVSLSGAGVATVFFFFFWLHWDPAAAPALSEVAASGSCSQVAAHRLLIVVASLVVEQGLQGTRTRAE